MDLFLLDICYNGFYLKLRVSNRGLKKNSKFVFPLFAKRCSKYPIQLFIFLPVGSDAMSSHCNQKFKQKGLLKFPLTPHVNYKWLLGLRNFLRTAMKSLILFPKGETIVV